MNLFLIEDQDSTYSLVLVCPLRSQEYRVESGTHSCYLGFHLVGGFFMGKLNFFIFIFVLLMDA